MIGALVAMAAAATGISLACTVEGAGLTPDSVHYIAAARNMLAGEGTVSFTGEPLVLWPPLLPATLAALAATGVEILSAARFLNAACYGSIVLLAGAGLWRVTASVWGALAAAALVALSVPLFSASTMVWSGPMFTALSLAAVLAMGGLGRKPSLRRVAIAAVPAALAAMTRYVGLATVLGGVAIVALSRGPSWRGRLARMGVYLAVGLGPLACWMVRNFLQAGTLAGRRGTPETGVVEALLAIGQQMALWALPWRVATWPAGWVWLALAAAALAIAAAWLLVRRGEGRVGRLALAAVAVVLAYVGLMALSAGCTVVDIDSRMLAPVYPLAVLLVVIGAVAGWRRAGSRFGPVGRRRLVRLGVVIIVGAWVASAAYTWADMAVGLRRRGPRGFAKQSWRQSPTLEYVRRQRPGGTVLSN